MRFGWDLSRVSRLPFAISCAAATVALQLGCGGAGGPPRGPDYTPEGTEEAKSECPEQWKLAKAAREEMLGDDSAAARTKTARAVLAQANCERAFLADGSFSPGVHAGILEQVAALRAEQRDTQNLYNGVAGYGVPLLRVAAALGRGELNGVFSRRLRAVPMPTDIVEVGEQSAFRTEVASLVSYFETEAERELRDAINLAETAPGAAEHRARACEQLEAINRTAPEACRGGR